MKSDGLLGLVHFAFSWQEGIRRPGLKLSTSSLVICKNSQQNLLLNLASIFTMQLSDTAEFTKVFANTVKSDYKYAVCKKI